MLRFGCRLLLFVDDFDIIRSYAKECERLNFDAVWVNDHLIPPSGLVSHPFLESWTVLASLAPLTQNIGLGTLVACNSFRLPPVLAKMSASLDQISNGRLTLGIGAGWMEQEYRMFGFPYDRAKVRIEQLSEAVQIIKRMWLEDKASFEGRYYSIKDAICSPKPVQKPHPPILIGGSGKRILRVIAQYADICNFGHGTTPDVYEQKLRILEDHCRSVGRNPGEIRKSHLTDIVIARTHDQLEELIKRNASIRNISVEENRRRMDSSIYGTPNECIEKIDAYAHLGVSEFILLFLDMTRLEDLKLFAEQVRPSVSSSN